MHTKNFFFIHSFLIKQKLREPTITLKTYKMPSTYYKKTSNFILNSCKKRQWHEDIVYQMFSCLQFIDCYRLINDVVFQSRFFSNGRADIFAIIPTYELMVCMHKLRTRIVPQFNFDVITETYSWSTGKLLAIHVQKLYVSNSL